MKKLLTLLMALVMVFALATPAMAWVGWDAPETADPEEEVFADFDLSGVRLEFFASSSAIFSWVNTYYAEYNPTNKGIVEGSHVRAYFKLGLPLLADLPAQIAGQIGTLAITFTPSNMQIDSIEVYKIIGSGSRTEMTKLYSTPKSTKAQKLELGSTHFDSKNEVTLEFMITGYSLAAKDVTLTAKLSCGAGSFTNGVYKFTTANGKNYTVTSDGNYFYIKNNAGTHTVRFTVDKDYKVTEVAVSATAATNNIIDIEPLGTTLAKAIAAQENDLDENIELIYEYQRKYVNSFLSAKGLEEIQKQIDDAKKYMGTLALEAFVNDLYEEAYVNLATVRGDKIIIVADPDEWTKAYYGPYDADSVASVLKLNAIYEIVAYYDIANIVYDRNGDATDVVFNGAPGAGKEKYGYLLGEVGYNFEDAWYVVTKNVNTGYNAFTLFSYDFDNGYMQRNKVAGADMPANMDATEWTAFKTEVAKYSSVAGYKLYFQLPTSNSGSSRVLDPGTAAYKAHEAAFKEILGVLGFEWDGTTKYMYEDKFIELFAGAVSTSETLTWKAYTADLIVPDGTEPPQTGDSASIVGFVMIALAVLAAGAVVIKKVRA